jgi:hypothetical protein
MDVAASLAQAEQRTFSILHPQTPAIRHPTACGAGASLRHASASQLQAHVLML